MPEKNKAHKHTAGCGCVGAKPGTEQTGIISIRFKAGASEEEIKEIITNLYCENSHIIKDMQYLEFRDPTMLDRVNDFLSKECGEPKKKNPQKTLTNTRINPDLPVKSGDGKKCRNCELINHSDRCIGCRYDVC